MVPRRVLRPLLVALLILVALAPYAGRPLSVGAAPTVTSPFPLVESFKQSNPDNPGWVIGGTARLTSGTSDPSGDGWLRLTSNASGQLGYAYYNVPFPSSQGIVISFDYAAWGGNGFDGSSFFLFDGATTTFVPGSGGGNLGYEPLSCSSPGLSNAYVGIGLDEGGDFSAPYCTTYGGPGATNNSVALRGSGNGTTGYRWLTGTGTLPTSLDVPGVPTRPSQTGPNYRHVIITVSANQLVTVQMQFGAGNSPQTLISQYDLTTAPGQEAVPSTLKFGFAGATGDFTNYHEIRNVTVISAAQPTANLTASRVGGTPFQTITVMGTTFGPSEPVSLYWDISTTAPLTTVMTAPDGSFQSPLTLPQTPSGSHLLLAVGQTSGQFGITTVQIHPSLILTPAAGPPGTTVVARGVGFGAADRLSLYWLSWFSPPLLLGTTTSNALGTIYASTAVTFTVPNIDPGSYLVVAKGQKATGVTIFTVH